MNRVSTCIVVYAVEDFRIIFEESPTGVVVSASAYKSLGNGWKIMVVSPAKTPIAGLSLW